VGFGCDLDQVVVDRFGVGSLVQATPDALDLARALQLAKSAS
jgi:hypothetical protein